MKTLITILLLCQFCAVTAQKTITVTGKVLDEKVSQPILGASILIVGSSIGTTSGKDGVFQLTVNNNDAVLQVSFAGYITQKIPVKGQKNITVSLSEDVAQLSDVVVVGYGRQKKDNLVGSVSTVQGDDIVKSNAPSLSNSLAGRVAGVIAIQRSAEPGDDDAELLIRGRATLNDNGPLVMVDGIQRGFSQIDPNEIATISVLKDASATAIYGTRGANGVILVTTKRGLSGKPSFSYSGNAGWQNVINIPDYINSYDYARLYNQAALNDDPNLSVLPYSTEDLQKYKDHSNPYTHPDVHWYKEIIQPNALQQRHSFSISGGSDKFRYFLLLGYLKQEGVLGSDNLKRYNSRVNIDADVTKSTTFSVTVAGDIQSRLRPGNADAKTDGGIFSLVTYLPPNAFPIKNEDGTWASLWGQNPVADISVFGKRNDQPTNLQTSATINQKLDFITKGLSLKLIMAHDFGYFNYKDWKVPYRSYFNGQEFGAGQLPELAEGYSKYNNTTFETHLNYNHTFNKHEVGALVLYTQSSYYSGNIDASRREFGSAALPQLFAGPRTNIDNNGGASEGGREGVLGRVTYGYDKKYLLEASFGYNGSENFPKGNRFGFFPAIGLGWNLKRETFMQRVNFINNLKLRASYGEVGNDNVGYRKFLYKAPVYFGGNYVFGGPTPVPVQTVYTGELANPFVTWERAKKTNFGFDADLKNSMFGVNVDVFFENRDNILSSRNQSVPGTFGASLPVENIAKVANNGFEVQLRYKNKAGALSYYANANYTFARNQIKFIDEAANIPAYQQRTGHPIGQFFGFIADGFYQTQKEIDDHPKFDYSQPKLGQIKYKDINNDGEIKWEDDVTAIGKSSTPENIYGLTIGAEFKGIDVSIFWQGASGYNVARNGESFTEFSYGGTALSYTIDNWTSDNPNATYPRLSLTDWSHKQENSTYWLRDAGYVRLKNLEVGYTFPNKLFGNNSISKLRIYATGTNLLTFSKEKDFDPESASGYPYYYPVTRLTSVGVNLSF